MINAIPHSDRNLVLTGYMGPNQIIVARRIAEALKMPFVNFESRLEARADLPIDDIRERFGEARLKALEAEVIDELILYRGVVILVSGQTMLHNESYARLQDTSIILCMVAALDAVLQRLHLSMGARFHNPNERSIALGHLKREWTIRSIEGVQEFDTTALNEDQTVDAIVAMWREQSIVTRG